MKNRFDGDARVAESVTAAVMAGAGTTGCSIASEMFTSVSFDQWMNRFID